MSNVPFIQDILLFLTKTEFWFGIASVVAAIMSILSEPLAKLR